MPEPAPSEKTQSSKLTRSVGSARMGKRRGALGLLALAAVVIGSLAATAFATSSALMLSSASNATLGKSVVVNPQGRTLYVLSPETSKHLLCKSRECLGNWPPLTVKSAKTKLKAGSGVKGKLGLLHRSNGVLQVTLNGLPLYRYAGDSGKDQANGEGIESFGGTWHAVTAASGASTQPSTTTPPSMPSTPSTPTPPPYQYPAY